MLASKCRDGDTCLLYHCTSLNLLATKAQDKPLTTAHSSKQCCPGGDKGWYLSTGGRPLAARTSHTSSYDTSTSHLLPHCRKAGILKDLCWSVPPLLTMGRQDASKTNKRRQRGIQRFFHSKRTLDELQWMTVQEDAIHGRTKTKR